MLEHNNLKSGRLRKRSSRVLRQPERRQASLQNSVRLHARFKRFAPSAPLPGQWFQVATLGLYLSLLYKVVPAGLALLLILSGSLYRLRKAEWHPNLSIIVLGSAYIALCTVTAFMVSFNDGANRSVQFTLVVTGSLAIAKYLAAADKETAKLFYHRFAVVNAVILLHIIIYHLSHGKIVTWKYLLDTKFAFSAAVIVLFYFEDDIRSRSSAMWYGALISLTVIILMSGERKAYLLLAAIFFLSRASIAIKASIISVSAAAALLFLAAYPNSYVARQLSGDSIDLSRVSNRAFLTTANIGDHSDEIRTFVNRNADAMFAQHPIIGVGATGYQEWARRRYGPLTRANGLSMNVHGERHRVPAENGLIGIAIVLSYLAAIGWSALMVVGHNGWLNSQAEARAPLYMLTLLVIYCYGEAMDTTMMLLIFMTGLVAANVHAPSIWQRRKRASAWRKCVVKAST